MDAGVGQARAGKAPARAQTGRLRRGQRRQRV